MEPRTETWNDFTERYWKYYLLLEKDFLKTEQYLSIDEYNFNAYSNEYIKEYQAICSEIDVIFKLYCKQLDQSFKGKTINSYCKCIKENCSDFSSRTVIIKDKKINIEPWKGWDYVVDQKQKIVSLNPDWWQKYNKIKHNRTTINTETQLPYYKFANQKNVLYSLAALYQLELYYFRTLHHKYFIEEPDMPGPPSKLFEIENWGNKWFVLEGDLRCKID